MVEAIPRIEMFTPVGPFELMRRAGTIRARSWPVLMLSWSSVFWVSAVMLIGTRLIASAPWRSAVTTTSVTSAPEPCARAAPPIQALKALVANSSAVDDLNMVPPQGYFVGARAPSPIGGARGFLMRTMARRAVARVQLPPELLPLRHHRGFAAKFNLYRSPKRRLGVRFRG
ncbi:MAG: hypothetical protein WDM92_11825 [Caulobacteraceae bacterium]